MPSVSNLYLLPCSCGKTSPVEVSQAGDSVRCECGQTLQVPALRSLRELEPAGQQTAVAHDWGFRQGVLTLGVLIAVSFALAAGYYAWRKPLPPEPFSPDSHMAAVNASMDRLTLPQAVGYWINNYAPLRTRGFGLLLNPDESRINQEIVRCQSYRDRLLIAAGVVLGATLAAVPLLPR